MPDPSPDQAPLPGEPPPAPTDIEVGAAERGIRYWLAKEAVRQGEARLNAQNAVRTALEARATAITGWAAVGFLATIGAGFAAKDTATTLGAITAGGCLFMAGAMGIIAARPRVWSLVGYEPDPVLALSDRLGTELEALESISGGLADGVRVNNRRISRMAFTLRWAGWLLLFGPLAGGIAYRVTPTLCGYSAGAAWAMKVAGLARASDCPQHP